MNDEVSHSHGSSRYGGGVAAKRRNGVVTTLGTSLPNPHARGMSAKRLSLALLLLVIAAQLFGLASASPAAATGTTSDHTFVCQTDTPTGNCLTNAHPVAYGQPVMLLVNVIDDDNGCTFFNNDANCDPPTGQVQLFDGAAALPFTSATLSDSHYMFGDRSSGRFSYAGLPVGVHTIHAVYFGDDEFAPSFYDFSLTITKAPSFVNYTGITPEPTVFGQNVPLQAAVAPAGATGTVQFLDGTTPIGSPVAVDSGGLATTNTTALSVGTHFLNAEYSGDANLSPSKTQNNPMIHHVNKGGAVGTVTSSANPAVWGQNVTFTITVSASAPSAGNPTGVVALKEAGATVSGDLTLVNGHAQFSTTGLDMGSHVIDLVYAGDANFAGFTALHALDQTVIKADSATALTSSTNPSNFGDPVTFTATVTPVAPGAGTPTGTVQFKDGASLLGAPVPVTAGGTAAMTVSNLGGGPHPITAVYSGDVRFNGSTSAALTQNVTCDHTYTGTINGTLTVPASSSSCITAANVTGLLVVPIGATVSVTNSVIGNNIQTTGSPAALQVCGSEIHGGLQISNVTGLLLIGDRFESACANNTIFGGVTITAAKHGLKLVGNKIYGGATITKSSGGPIEVGANTLNGMLACAVNTPAATNNGHPNTAGARSGECAAANF